MNLLVALGIGVLLGLERERHKGRGPGRGAAGVRTFALAALAGGIAARLGVAVVAVCVAFAGGAAIASYLRASDDDPGMTTEVALVVAVLLGALAADDPALAAGLGAAVAILLEARRPLHRFARDVLTEQEVHDGLLLAAAALIVLPLVPDRGVGPEGSLNPQTVWRLVVLVMLIGALAHVALRALGPRRGLPLAGFLGGFVSGAATVAAMGARAVRESGLHRPAVAGAVLATLTTVLLDTIVVGSISPRALRELAPALAAGGVAAAAYGVATLRAGAAHEAGTLELGRVFDLKAPLLLAGTITAVLVGSAVLRDSLGDSGVTLAATVAGFADAQAAAGSVAALVAAGQLDAEAAAVPVLAAFTANSITKSVLAVTLGGKRFGALVTGGLVAVVGAAWAGWALS